MTRAIFSKTFESETLIRLSQKLFLVKLVKAKP